MEELKKEVAELKEIVKKILEILIFQNSKKASLNRKNNNKDN